MAWGTVCIALVSAATDPQKQANRPRLISQRPFVPMSVVALRMLQLYGDEPRESLRWLSTDAPGSSVGGDAASSSRALEAEWADDSSGGGGSAPLGSPATSGLVVILGHVRIVQMHLTVEESNRDSAALVSMRMYRPSWQASSEWPLTVADQHFDAADGEKCGPCPSRRCTRAGGRAGK